MIDDYRTAVQRIVRILQADPSERFPGDIEGQRHIAKSVDAYRAAVTELVLAGNLNMDQGAELMAMVDRIVEEMR